MTVPTQPEITQDQLKALLAALLPDVTLDTVSKVEITPGKARVWIYALDAEGKRFLGSDKSPAMHVVTRKVLTP